MHMLLHPSSCCYEYQYPPPHIHLDRLHVHVATSWYFFWFNPPALHQETTDHLYLVEFLGSMSCSQTKQLLGTMRIFRVGVAVSGLEIHRATWLIIFCMRKSIPYSILTPNHAWYRHHQYYQHGTSKSKLDIKMHVQKELMESHLQSTMCLF